MGQSYKTDEGKYLKPCEMILKDGRHVDKETKKPVIITWEKMSKSKYNGVNPLQMFEEHSTDTIRLVILSDVAPTSHRNWSQDSKYIFLVYPSGFFYDIKQYSLNLGGDYQKLRINLIFLIVSNQNY